KLDVDRAMCKQGRGKRALKCKFYDGCAYQRQKQVKADVWFAAHEMIVHKKPKAFGDIGLVLIDESPLDAFLFGIEDEMELGLDTLRNGWSSDSQVLAAGKDLYRVLDKLRVPISHHLGVPVERASMEGSFIWRYDGESYHVPEWNAGDLAAREWRSKIKVNILPTMSDKRVKEIAAKAAINVEIDTRARLWRLIEQLEEELKHIKRYGRIQMHRGKHGRVIRMVGLKPIAKGWH